MFQKELKAFSVSSLYLATFLYITQGHRLLPLCTSSTVNIPLSAVPSTRRKPGDKSNNKDDSRVCTKCFLLFLQLKAATNPVLPSGLRKWGIALPAEQSSAGNRINIYQKSSSLVGVLLVMNATYPWCNHHFLSCGGRDRTPFGASHRHFWFCCSESVAGLTALTVQTSSCNTSMTWVQTLQAKRIRNFRRQLWCRLFRCGQLSIRQGNHLPEPDCCWAGLALEQQNQSTRMLSSKVKAGN